MKFPEAFRLAGRRERSLACSAVMRGLLELTEMRRNWYRCSRSSSVTVRLTCRSNTLGFDDGSMMMVMLRRGL